MTGDLSAARFYLLCEEESVACECPAQLKDNARSLGNDTIPRITRGRTYRPTSSPDTLLSAGTPCCTVFLLSALCILLFEVYKDPVTAVVHRTTLVFESFTSIPASQLEPRYPDSIYKIRQPFCCFFFHSSILA